MSITPTATLRTLDDDALLERVRVLADDSRRVEADLIAHLAEVDREGSWLGTPRPRCSVTAGYVEHHITGTMLRTPLCCGRTAQPAPMAVAALANTT